MVDNKDNIKKMLKEVFGKEINDINEIAPASTSSEASTLSDQDYVNQYTAFLKQILERAKIRESMLENNKADILDEIENLLKPGAIEATTNGQVTVANETEKADILSAVTELLKLKTTTDGNGVTRATGAENGVTRANIVDGATRANETEKAYILDEIENLLKLKTTTDGATEPENGPIGTGTEPENEVTRETGETEATGTKKATGETEATAKASSCGDANVCIENINNEGEIIDTKIYETVGTGKERVIVETIIPK